MNHKNRAKKQFDRVRDIHCANNAHTIFFIFAKLRTSTHPDQQISIITHISSPAITHIRTTRTRIQQYKVPHQRADKFSICWLGASGSSRKTHPARDRFSLKRNRTKPRKLSKEGNAARALNICIMFTRNYDNIIVLYTYGEVRYFKVMYTKNLKKSDS